MFMQPNSSTSTTSSHRGTVAVRQHEITAEAEQGNPGGNEL